MRIPISLFLKDNILGHRDQFNKLSIQIDIDIDIDIYRQTCHSCRVQFFPVKLYNELICNFYIVCITIATAVFGNIFITLAEYTSQLADIYHFICTLAFAPLLSVFRDLSNLGHIHSHVLINAACRILFLAFFKQHNHFRTITCYSLYKYSVHLMAE